MSEGAFRRSHRSPHQPSTDAALARPILVAPLTRSARHRLTDRFDDAKKTIMSEDGMTVETNYNEGVSKCLDAMPMHFRCNLMQSDEIAARAVLMVQ